MTSSECPSTVLNISTPLNSNTISPRPPPISTIGVDKLWSLGIDIHPVPYTSRSPSVNSMESSPRAPRVASIRLGTEREDEEDYRQLNKEEDEYRRLNPLKTRSIFSLRRRSSLKETDKVRCPPISSLPKERLGRLGIDCFEPPRLLELSLDAPNPLIGKAINVHNRGFVYLFPKKNQATETPSSRSSSIKAQPVSLLNSTTDRGLGCPSDLYYGENLENLKFCVDEGLRSQQNQDFVLGDVWGVLHQQEIQKELHPLLYESRDAFIPQGRGFLRTLMRDLQQHLCVLCCPPHDVEDLQSTETVALELGCRWKRKEWRENYIREWFPAGTKFYIDPRVRIDVSIRSTDDEQKPRRKHVPIMPKSTYEQLEQSSPETTSKRGVTKDVAESKMTEEEECRRKLDIV